MNHKIFYHKDFRNLDEEKLRQCKAEYHQATTFFKTFKDLLKGRLEEMDSAMDKIALDQNLPLKVAGMVEKRKCLREILKLFEESAS